MRTLVLALAAAALSPLAAQAQTPLFAEDSEIAFTVEAPFGDLVRSAARSTDPYPATLTLTSDAAAPTFALEVSARGLSRRTRGFCDFPPIRLDFDRDGDVLDGTLFDGQNRLKLVTHCKASARYERLVAMEMMVYRLYAVLTDASFRVRPAQVTYRYSDRDGREETRFGFLIEDVDDLADRIGMEAVEVGSGEVASAQLDATAAAQFALFEFMIGNLDWDMTHGPEPDECCHNARLIFADEESRTAVIPTPYDFDHSGLVDAPYANPPEQVDISSVRTRRYWGLCIHNGALPAVVETFRTRRDDFMAAIASAPRLTENDREDAQEYLEGFYEILDDERRFERQVIERCRD